MDRIDIKHFTVVTAAVRPRCRTRRVAGSPEVADD